VRRAARVDDNQADIVLAARMLGCGVLSLAALGHGVPDLLIYKPGRGYFLIEIKDGRKIPSKRKLNPVQAAFKAGWRGPIDLVESVEDLLRLLKNPRKQVVSHESR
jgi:hypothetical protein